MKPSVRGEGGERDFGSLLSHQCPRRELRKEKKQLRKTAKIAFAKKKSIEKVLAEIVSGRHGAEEWYVILEICEDRNMQVRMQAIATACVYFRRFYSRRSFKDIDPFLLAPACISVASKVEENGMISSTKLIPAVAAALKKRHYLSQKMPVKSQKDLQVAEFYLLEIMDCCLIIYQPYRPLTHLMRNFPTKDVELIQQDTWCVHDYLRSEIPLLYPPHLIAIAAIMMSAMLNGREKDIKGWLVELAVDFEKVWKSFDEKEHLLQIWERMAKPRS